MSHYDEDEFKSVNEAVERITGRRLDESTVARSKPSNRGPESAIWRRDPPTRPPKKPAGGQYGPPMDDEPDQVNLAREAIDRPLMNKIIQGHSKGQYRSEMERIQHLGRGPMEEESDQVGDAVAAHLKETFTGQNVSKRLLLREIGEAIDDRDFGRLGRALKLSEMIEGFRGSAGEPITKSGKKQATSKNNLRGSGDE